MLENLSFVLMGLAAIVAFLTYVGAHNSPLPIPNMSKPGCIVSAILLLAGMGAGLYPPVAKYNNCASDCETALTDMHGEHGDLDEFVSPARVAYQACHKGAQQAAVKAELAAKEAGGIAIEKDSPEVIEARCMAQARERCTMTCFESPKR